MYSRFHDWARTIRKDVLTLYYAARDPRVPLLAKFLASFVVAYALSPIDLIPDFIPVLGLVDDLIVVPIGILVVVKLIPKDVLAELRIKAEAHSDGTRRSWIGAGLVLLLWIMGVVILIRLFGPSFTSPRVGPTA